MQEGKPPVFLKVDWDKWVDVDEDDEKCECSFHSLSHRTEKKKLCGYQLWTSNQYTFLSAGGDMDFGNFDFSVSNYICMHSSATKISLGVM